MAARSYLFSRVTCIAYLSGFLISNSLRGQTTGNISGRVADPAGEVIDGAALTVRETATGVARHSKTNLAGSYTFPALQVGNYELIVQVPGFKTYRRNAMQVDANAAIRVDVSLELGEQQETLTVTEQNTVVESANTGMGEVISGSTIAATPLNGRSFTDLLALQAGVVPLSSAQPNAVVMTGVSSTPPSGDLNPGSLSVSGQRETANGFLVNGSDAEEDVNMGTSIIPNLDSIAEFRILTNNFTAEYGNYSGGQVIVVTKSGSNQVHGNVFEYLRNTALDARNFFSATRATYIQNQFGGTLGGPIQRNRIFFFADYQGSRTDQGLDTGLIAVPSLQDRSGNLQDLASSLSGTVTGQAWAKTLTSRLGYPVMPGEAYYQGGCFHTSQWVFPSAIIPKRAWSVPARNLLPYIPAPNQSTNLFSTSTENQTVNDGKGAVRLDANARAGTVSAYYFTDNYSLLNPYPTQQGGATLPGFSARNHGQAQLASISDTKSFGGTAINEAHLSYIRNQNEVGQPIGNVGPSLASQGFTGIVPLEPGIEGIENVQLNNYTFGLTTTGLSQANNIYQVRDIFSKVMGTHTVKLGGEVHFDQVNTNPDVISNGSQAYLGTETGLDFADFLLGITSTYTQGQAHSFYERNKYIGFFAQDSWRLRNELTVDYGLRWDGIFAWSEKYNQLQTLVPGQQSTVFSGAPTGLVFPGDRGVPSTLAPNRYKNFAPRLGLAYSPDYKNALLHRLFGSAGKTSFRAGYGLFYTAIEGLSAGIMSGNPPYGLTYTSAAPTLADTPFITASSGQDQGQRFPLQQVPYGATTKNPNRSVDWSQFEPLVGVPGYSPDNVVPYTETYMASLQRQFGSGTLLSLSYVGSQAHHLLAILQANPGNPALCLSLSQPGEVAANSPTCGPFKESSQFVKTDGSIIQGTRTAFSSLFGSVGYQKTIANSNYNALQVTLHHQQGPQQMLFSYTYGKSIDQSSSLAEPLNPVNQALTRAPSAFDLKHNMVFSYQYDLALNRLIHHWRQLTGGWSIAGVSRFSTGFPVTLYNNNDTSLLGTIPNAINNNGIDTPDYLPGALRLNLDPRNGKPAFNTESFSLPALGQLGTASRRFFYGPGIENFDFAISKKGRISESQSLVFRAEAFNVFNHAQFYGPAAVNGNLSTSNFGKIVSAAAPRVLQLALKFQF